MEFSRQEYWSELPLPFPGDLPDAGIKLMSPALQVDSLPSEPSGKPLLYHIYISIYIYRYIILSNFKLRYAGCMLVTLVLFKQLLIGNIIYLSIVLALKNKQNFALNFGSAVELWASDCPNFFLCKMVKEQQLFGIVSFVHCKSI